MYFVIQLCFHIEPFDERTAYSLREAIKYIIDKYGSHKAFYRRRRKGRDLPLFYMYDSYQVQVKEWKKLFSVLESMTVRNTEYDGIFIGWCLATIKFLYYYFNIQIRFKMLLLIQETTCLPLSATSFRQS